MRIDSHVHLFDVAQSDSDLRHPDYSANFDQVSDIGERIGFTHFVLTQPSFLGFDNRLLFAVANKANNVRLVPWIDERADLEELNRNCNGQISGLRFPIKFSGMPSWDAYDDVFRIAKKLNIHAELLANSSDLCECIDALFQRDINVVLPHLGLFNAECGPKNDIHFLDVLRKAQSGRLWFKISAHYRSRESDAKYALLKILKMVPPERIVWGSDWPHVGNGGDTSKTVYENCINWFTHQVDDKILLEKILSKNPKELYRF